MTNLSIDKIAWWISLVVILRFINTIVPSNESFDGSEQISRCSWNEGGEHGEYIIDHAMYILW